MNNYLSSDLKKILSGNICALFKTSFFQTCWQQSKFLISTKPITKLMSLFTCIHKKNVTIVIYVLIISASNKGSLLLCWIFSFYTKNYSKMNSKDKVHRNYKKIWKSLTIILFAILICWYFLGYVLLLIILGHDHLLIIFRQWSFAANF